MRAAILSVCLTSLLMACSFPAASTTTSQSPPDQQGRNEFEVILDEFRANSRAAEQKHKGRLVTVNGVVHSAEWSDKKSKGPHAILWVGDEKTVIGTFYDRRQVDDVLALKKGQSAQVRGRILNGSYIANDRTLYVMVDGCELLSPLQAEQK